MLSPPEARLFYGCLAPFWIFTAVWELAVAKFELWFAGAARLMALVLDGDRK